MGKSVGSLMIATVLLFSVVLLPVAAQGVTLQVAIADHGKTPMADLTEMVAEFERQYPEIKIEILNDYANSFDRFTTHVAGGVAPDIVHFYNEAPILSMETGLLLDLTPYIQRDGQAIVRDLLPLTLEQVSKDGSIYGLPFQTSATGAVFFNRVMFDHAGIAHPDGSWDWAEFAEIARKLTRFNGDAISQIGYQQNSSWLWYFPWLAQAGVDFSEPMRVPLATPEAVRAFEFLREWIDREAFGWRRDGEHFPSRPRR